MEIFSQIFLNSTLFARQNNVQNTIVVYENVKCQMSIDCSNHETKHTALKDICIYIQQGHQFYFKKKHPFLLNFKALNFSPPQTIAHSQMLKENPLSKKLPILLSLRSNAYSCNPVDTF